MKARAETNVNSTQLLNIVSAQLDRAGYQQVEGARFRAASYLQQPIYASQFHLGESIYQTDWFVDFVLFHPKKWPKGLIIEARWQQEKGTVDEKYPYLVQNLKERCDYPGIVILGGNGCRPGAIAWLRQQVDGKQLLQVFGTGDDFIAWANRGRL
jgi:hypothetical protein